MKMQFTLGNAGRKKLVDAMSKILSTEAKYMGAPSFCYNVGGCIIDRNGYLDIPNDVNAKAVSDQLSELGFERKKDTVRFVISLPSHDIDDRALDNLNKLIAAKSYLIQKALDSDSTAIKNADGKIIFDWFPSAPMPDEISAYTQFLEALVKMAKEQQRVSAKPTQVENEKYAFRCFLLRLGFIGKEYSGTRNILLSRLYGEQSYKEIYNTKLLNEGDSHHE